MLSVIYWTILGIFLFVDFEGYVFLLSAAQLIFLVWLIAFKFNDFIMCFVISY
jgi:hypothetical protein